MGKIVNFYLFTAWLLFCFHSLYSYLLLLLHVRHSLGYIILHVVLLVFYIYAPSFSMGLQGIYVLMQSYLLIIHKLYCITTEDLC